MSVHALPPRAWLAVAVTTLGVALGFHNGHLDPAALAFLVLTWCAVVAAFVSRTPDGDRPVERVLLVGVVVQLAFSVARPPGDAIVPMHELLAGVYPVAQTLMAMCAVSILLERPLLGRSTFGAVVALFGLSAAWMLVASPHPVVDVVDFERQAVRALLQGRNPYADLHLANPYGHTRFFGPGFATDRTIEVGWVYPPLSLLLLAPAEALVHDARAALAVALVLSALLIDRMGGRTARLAALLFVSSPRQLFVLEQGWTEPLLVACFALVLLLVRRSPAGTAVALGALLALKQVSVLFLPLTPLLVGELRPRRSVALVAVALGVAALVVGPFLLRDPGAYLRSTVLFHAAQPFRDDSLNFAAFWAWARGGVAPPTSLPSLALAGGALLVALWRCRPTPAGFAAGCGLVLLAMLAWFKQAHCNYYFLVIGLLLCSVAATVPRSTVADGGRTVG